MEGSIHNSGNVFLTKLLYSVTICPIMLTGPTKQATLRSRREVAERVGELDNKIIKKRNLSITCSILHSNHAANIVFKRNTHMLKQNI